MFLSLAMTSTPFLDTAVSKSLFTAPPPNPIETQEPSCFTRSNTKRKYQFSENDAVTVIENV